MTDAFDDRAEALWRYSMNKREFMRHFREMLRETDQRARAEEREACARVAEEYSEPDTRTPTEVREDTGEHHRYISIVTNRGWKIATAIRERKP